MLLSYVFVRVLFVAGFVIIALCQVDDSEDKDNEIPEYADDQVNDNEDFSSLWLRSLHEVHSRDEQVDMRQQHKDKNKCSGN